MTFFSAWQFLCPCRSVSFRVPFSCVRSCLERPVLIGHCNRFNSSLRVVQRLGGMGNLRIPSPGISPEQPLQGKVQYDPLNGRQARISFIRGLVNSAPRRGHLRAVPSLPKTGTNLQHSLTSFVEGLFSNNGYRFLKPGQGRNARCSGEDRDKQAIFVSCRQYRETFKLAGEHKRRRTAVLIRTEQRREAPYFP